MAKMCCNADHSVTTRVRPMFKFPFAFHRRGVTSIVALAASALSIFGVLFWVASATAAGQTGAEKPTPVARIAFVGDSIVDNYWSGVERMVSANACLKSRIRIGRYARNSTGLTRGDKLYWPRHVLNIEKSFKPTLMVVSLGLNDQQFIVDKNRHRTPWGAPNWSEKYRAEIDEFLTQATASHATVLVVGMPIMRERWINSDVLVKNKWFADAIANFKMKDVHYIEPWRLKPSSPDVYSSYGRDHNGRMAQIRTSDGQHFTPAGEDIVAAYLFPKIVSALNRTGVRLDTCMGTSAK